MARKCQIVVGPYFIALPSPTYANRAVVVVCNLRVQDEAMLSRKSGPPPGAIRL